VLTATRRIPPLPVLTGVAQYPADAVEALRARSRRVVALDADAIAADVGNPRAANIVMLGALSRLVDLPVRAWEQAVVAAVPARGRESSLEAFRRGRDMTP
jgi:indolepyruvate ferredoxin oxidoreductase beta subunit